MMQVFLPISSLQLTNQMVSNKGQVKRAFLNCSTLVIYLYFKFLSKIDMNKVNALHISLSFTSAEYFYSFNENCVYVATIQLHFKLHADLRDAFSFLSSPLNIRICLLAMQLFSQTAARQAKICINMYV